MRSALQDILDCAKANGAAYVNMPIGTLAAIIAQLDADAKKIEELRGYVHGAATLLGAAREVKP